MSIKRMSLRFNLNNEADLKAWEICKKMQQIQKTKAVITAINGYL